MTTKVVTGKVRFSYVNIAKPRAMEEGDTPKYGLAILISKKDKLTLKKIRAAIEAAKQDGKNKKFGGKIPKNLKTPLRDGDEDREEDEAFEGMMFINANSHRQPQVLDEDKEEMLDLDEFYSGCYGRASINFYAYDGKSKGIACGLNNLQKLGEGEPLSGDRTSAQEDFDDDYEDDGMMD